MIFNPYKFVFAGALSRERGEEIHSPGRHSQRDVFQLPRNDGRLLQRGQLRLWNREKEEKDQGQGYLRSWSRSRSRSWSRSR